jgi:hypothetical protein
MDSETALRGRRGPECRETEKSSQTYGLTEANANGRLRPFLEPAAGAGSTDDGAANAPGSSSTFDIDFWEGRTCDEITAEARQE